MSVSVEVPPLGDSVTEAIIGELNKQPGEFIEQDEILASLETDKVSVDIPAPTSGVVKELKVNIDDTVGEGDVIAIIEPGEKSAAASSEGGSDSSASSGDSAEADASGDAGGSEGGDDQALLPSVARLLEENDLKPSDVSGTGPGGRILKGDVLAFLEKGGKKSAKPAAKSEAPSRPSVDTTTLEERKRMSPLRKTIARRLVEAQQETAMLTTFNEVDMTNLMAIRKKYQERFVERHGTKLGFMSFFAKAVIEGLKEYPAVNAEIDDEANEIIYKNYYHIGVAIGGGKGLVVPVVRDADQMSFAEIELEIKRLAELAMKNKLKMEDLQGGTFTISNGGVYGSMMSTPILNRPQSGILGMHNIVQRPMVVDGQIVARPMMYLALSYDHRIIDGREAVSFLVRVKECIENPERILFEV